MDGFNTERPHQSLDGATPAECFHHADTNTGPVELARLRIDRRGESWVNRRVAANGVSVSWQQICLGAATSTSTSATSYCKSGAATN